MKSLVHHLPYSTWIFVEEGFTKAAIDIAIYRPFKANIKACRNLRKVSCFYHDANVCKWLFRALCVQFLHIILTDDMWKIR